MNRDLAGLEHSEISLGTASFAVTLGKFIVCALIVFSETPYTFVDVNTTIFQLIWITATLVMGFDFSALILFLYSKHIFLEYPRWARVLQTVGTACFCIACVLFIFSFGGLVWGYADTSELLHFSNYASKIITFLIVIVVISLGPIIVSCHYLALCLCRKKDNNLPIYERPEFS